MTIFTKKRVLYNLVGVAAVIALTEILLRTIWGFGNMVLFREDKNYEYIAISNQDRVRFGNRIAYNEYSMRSKPLQDSDSCVILGFGDSVLNGGTLIDHDSLATTIVENQLNAGVRLLNISSPSWGPDNCAAYLKENGDFNASMIILMISSHDAHDNMTFEKTVGYHAFYPDRQYMAATYELVARYVLPNVTTALTAATQARSQNHELRINKDSSKFNPGFDILRNHARNNNIPFIVFLHQEADEINQKKYFPGGEEIIKYCNENNIKLVSGMDIGENASHLYDNIHLNENGQKFWSKVLLQTIMENLVCK